MAPGVEDEPDSTRSYSEDEERRLTENLLSIQLDIEHGRYRDERLDVRLLLDLHRRLFSGVRDHAGRHRQVHFGSEYLIFGGHRSSHRGKVATELDRLFERMRRQIDDLRSRPGSATYERDAILVAATAHAEVVRIHPFEDGNGRTSRLLMDLLLVLLDLQPIPVNATKQEYYAVMEAYIGRREVDPLLSFYVRLYAGLLGS